MRRCLTAIGVVVALSTLAVAARAEGVCWDEHPAEGLRARGCAADRRVTSPPPTVSSDQRVVLSSMIDADTPAGRIGSQIVIRQDTNTFPGHTYRQTGATAGHWYRGDLIRDAHANVSLWQSRSTANDQKSTYVIVGSGTQVSDVSAGAGVAVGQTRGWGNPCRGYLSGSVGAGDAYESRWEDLGECPVEAPDLPDVPLPQ